MRWWGSLRPPRRAAAPVLLLSLVGMPGCGGEPPPPSDVIVRIDGEELRYADLERYLETNAPSAGSGIGSRVMSRLLDRLIDEELLRRVARSRGLDATQSDSRAALEALMAQLVRESGPPADPSPGEIEAYYLEHAREFRLEERVRLRQLLLDDPTLAERIRREWVAGVPFDDLVSRYSEAISAYQSDGDTLTREDLPALLAETIFALEPGEVSEVVTADYGYHLFQVTRRLPAEEVPLEVAAETIRERLGRRRNDRDIEVLLQQARERYNVRVFDRNIPFDYEGDYE